MKTTDIRMEWTDTGAVVSFTSDIIPAMNCPRCTATVGPDVEHRCGDMLPKPPKRKRGKSA